jgi:hypothetical protein
MLISSLPRDCGSRSFWDLGEVVIEVGPYLGFWWWVSILLNEKSFKTNMNLLLYFLTRLSLLGYSGFELATPEAVFQKLTGRDGDHLGSAGVHTVEPRKFPGI